MTTNNFKWPPEGKKIIVSLRESNGEHGLYSCIYMGMGIFKFLQNGEQYACEIREETVTGESIKNGVPTINEKVSNIKIYLIGKELISWYQPRRATNNVKAIVNMLGGDQNDED